jgi:hypothetical protein
MLRQLMANDEFIRLTFDCLGIKYFNIIPVFSFSVSLRARMESGTSQKEECGTL